MAYNNTFEILNDAYSGSSLSVNQVNNTYEVLLAVHNPTHKALNVNVLNIGTGMTIGGTDTMVQWNNDGVFTGSTGFVYDSTNTILTAPNISSTGDISGSTIYSGSTDLYDIFLEKNEDITINGNITITGNTTLNGYYCTTKTISGTSYSLLSGDNVIIVDSLSAMTFTIPTAQMVDGRTFTIIGKSTFGGRTATLVTEGSETINGKSAYTISTTYESGTLINDGSNWYELSN